MIRVAGAVAWAMCGAAFACGNPGDTVAGGARYAIAFKPSPAPIRTGEHFVLDVTVCPIGNAPAPRTVRVDASMPEHRHGMNYKTTVTARGPGRYRAEGLLFHMSGRWELAFDVVAANATERITSTIELK